MRFAEAAAALVKSRNYAITRTEVYDAILGKDDVDPSVPTFKDWVTTWLDDRARMRDIQPDVIKSYRRILTSRAVPFLGHLRLTEIDPDQIRNWVAWISSSRITIGSKNRRDGDRLVSTTTIRRTHAILHACLGAAVPKWLTVNPAARPAGSSKHTSGLPKKTTFEGMFLRADEINLILDQCDQPIREMAEVAVRSGMRLGELIALEAQYVVFDRDGAATILVRKALKNDGTVGEPKSAMSRRPITVDEPTSRLLARRVEGKKPAALVFPSPRGGMWDEGNLRDRYWYRAVAAAMRCVEHPPPSPPKPTRGPTRQLRVDEVSTCSCPTRLHRRPRFHDLRHTHASLLIKDRWHAKKIQLRLGHATYQTTMNIYGHLYDTGDRAELAGIDALLAPEMAPIRVPLPRRTGSVPRRVRHAAARRLLVRR